MSTHKSLTIDGIDYTKDATFEFKLKHSRTTDQATGYKFIDKISFSGEAYQVLNKTYFEDFDKTKIYELVTTPNCCDVDAELKLGYRDLRKCACTIEATPKTKESDVYDKLKTSAWYDNGFSDSNENLRVYFFGGGNWITVVIMIIYNWIIEPIVDIINAIDKILDTGKIDKGPLEASICGGPNYHLGYLFREILEYQCNFFGLKFESSILQGDYRNLAFIPCSNNEGFDLAQTVNFDKVNAPSYSVLQMLVIIQDAFNAKYWIEEGVLKFERKDKYFKTDIVLVDLVKEGLSQDLCYEHEDSTGYASGNYKYSHDPLDGDSNALAERYNDRVEWNSPKQDWQKGVKDVLLKDFSPSHYMRDGYNNDTVNTLRTQITGRLYDLLLSDFRAQQNKLMLWDGQSKEDARPTRVKDGKLYRFNRELYFNQFLPVKELYQGFHIIDDPRGFTELIADELEWSPKNFCEAAELVKKYGLRCGIKNTFVIKGVDIDINGMAEEIEIDFETKVIKFSKITWIHYN